MTRSLSNGNRSSVRRATPRIRRSLLHVTVAVISPMDAINLIVQTEHAQHVITPEAVRAFIHPVIPFPAVMPIIFRSRDDVAEADEIHRSRRAQAEG